MTGAKKVPINLQAPLATGAAHYAWSLVSAPAEMDVSLVSQGRYATVEASRSGRIEVMARTTVDGAQIRESRFEVTVINQPPTAMFTATPGGGARLSGFLDASRSGDPDREEVTYAWLVEGPGEATTEPNASTSLLASAPGMYSIRLVATDEEGATAEATGALRIFDSVFDSIRDTPSFGNPVYAWAAGTLVFPGGAIGIVDVSTGALDTVAVAGSTAGLAVTPDGRAVLIDHFGGPLEYYDAVGQASVGTVDAGGRDWTPVDGAIYWIAEDATGARLQRYDVYQQQVFDTAPIDDHVHPPIVSTALGGVVVPVGTATTVERFEIYDFGAPPILTATVAASLPWGTADVFAGGDRVSVRGGPIYQITLNGVRCPKMKTPLGGGHGALSVRWMERETGVEPATSTLARSHSTSELLPLTEQLFSEAAQHCQGVWPTVR